MSIASMADHKILRDAPAGGVQPAAAPAAPGPAPEPAHPQPVGVKPTVVNQLVRYIPTEAIGLYIAFLALLTQRPGAGDQVCALDYGGRWIAFGVFCAFTALLVIAIYAAKVRRLKQRFRFPLFEVFAGVTAFAAWAVSLPDTPLKDICGYKPETGAFIVLAVTVVLAALGEAVGGQPVNDDGDGGGDDDGDAEGGGGAAGDPNTPDAPPAETAAPPAGPGTAAGTGTTAGTGPAVAGAATGAMVGDAGGGPPPAAAAAAAAPEQSNTTADWTLADELRRQDEIGRGVLALSGAGAAALGAALATGKLGEYELIAFIVGVLLIAAGFLAVFSLSVIPLWRHAGDHGPAKAADLKIGLMKAHLSLVFLGLYGGVIAAVSVALA